MTRIPTRKAFLHERGIHRDRLIDKLVERWVFERSIVNIYSLARKRLAQLPGAPPIAERLDEIARQEQLHVEMLEALLDVLGRAPRDMDATPAVNVAATQAAGLQELLRGREHDIEQVLEVLLSAEVLDGTGWELLIDLGRAADLDEEWMRSFRAAEREEAEHRHFLRTHLEQAQRRALYGEETPAY
jgi:ferritin-like protein